jgi:hypothetical protein
MLLSLRTSQLIVSLEQTFGSRTFLALVLVTALGCAGLLVSQGMQPCDDAYITFRHAKNIALHGRPAWNLTGQPVLGSTSPIFMFGLGALGWLVGAQHIEQIALYANAFIMIGVVVLVYLVSLHLLGRRFPALLAAMLAGFNSINLFILSLGFEAGLFILCGLGSLYAAARSKDGWAVVLASAAPLVRPEGVLFAPLVWGLILLRRRANLRLLAVFLVVPVLWAIFATGYYGSPIPHSILAKKKFPAIYYPFVDEEVDLIARVATLPSALASLWQDEALPLLTSGERGANEGGPVARTLLYGALVALFLLLASFVARRDVRIVYVAYPPLFLLLFAWIGRVEIWYWPSFVIFSVLLLFAASAKLAAKVLDRGTLSRWKASDILSVGVFALFLGANHYTWADPQSDTRRRGFIKAEDPRVKWSHQWERERYDGYRQAATRLNARKAGLGTTLISEVGVFGYFYEGEVIDAVGLCSPEALRFYPPPRRDIYDRAGRRRIDANNIVPTAMIVQLEPKYVVSSRLYIDHLLQPGSPLLKDYTKIGVSGVAWNHPIQLYRRTDRISKKRED